MVSTSAIRDWQWPGPENFLCSSNPALLQRDAISAALDSELLWWAKPLDETSLDKMLRNSLCLAVYHMQQTESRDGEDGEPVRKMVGLTRVITDGVTFGYMTDVYVLPEYQRQGLGRWMMLCLNEILEEWEAMRGFWLLSGNPQATKLYMSFLGTDAIGTCRVASSTPELSVLVKLGPGFPRDQSAVPDQDRPG